MELSEDTYRRWKEVKQQLNLGTDNALAVHLLSYLSQPLLTLSPLDQGKGTFESHIAFPMDIPSMLEYAVFVLLCSYTKTSLHIALL